MRVVIASVVTSAHLPIKNLAAGSASKFATAENEGVFQHASGFEIMQKRRNGLIHRIGIAAMPFFQACMLVP